MNLDSTTRPITSTEQAIRQWIVEIDGKEIRNVSSVRVSSAFGTLNYGWTPAGHDGWTFREAAGGGVVIIPYVLKSEQLLIGVIEQMRPLQGGQVWNVPRGFRDASEQPLSAAKRELREETGLAGGEVFCLEGRPVNPNSAFVETPDPEMGVQFFAVPLPEDALVELESNWYLRQSTGAIVPITEPDLEQIGELRFLDWTEAAKLGDMFTLAAISRLLAFLNASSELQLSQTLPSHAQLWRLPK